VNRITAIPRYGGGIAGLAVFGYSWFADHLSHPADDAGITLRYAERIARGLGFDYNDGESVNGASNPLHTLIEAGLLRLGCASGTAILLIASVCLGLTAAVLFATFARFYSRGAALFSVLALVAFSMPFESVVDGMETPIVMLLAALLFRALHARSELWPGIVLGALVANKLDGALAALAFAAVFVASRRRLPWRAAAVALLVAAPVFLVLIASFGSIVPNSMLVKLSLHARAWDMDPLWMHQLLLKSIPVLYLGAWVSLLWLPFARELERSFPIAVVQLWFLLYLATFACVNLGGPFPWYAAVPATHAVILSSFALHAVSTATFAKARGHRLTWDPRGPPRRAWAVALLLVLALGMLRGGGIAARLRPYAGPRTTPVATSWDIARQAAGAFLRKHTSRTELLATFEGLPAFEYEGPVYDFSLLNSRQDGQRFAGAVYLLLGPLPADPELAAVDGERRLVASFRYDATMGLYALYARLDSEIWKNGARHLVFPTPELWSGTPEEARGIRLEHRENTWILPSTGQAWFAVQAWSPPTLFFTPRCARAVRVAVGVNGVAAGSVEVAPNGPPCPVRIAPRDTDGRGQYTFLFDCTSEGSEDPLELDEVLVRSGEPLRAADFKLAFARDRELIEHVATAGLPCRTSRR
jgi:hypothetical protein